VMHRRRTVAFVVTLGVCCAGLIAALFGYANASAGGAAHRSSQVTSVTVTMTDFKFKLSVSKVPVGTVVFKVVNKGKIPHTFKICSSPSGSTTANACNGKVTTSLASGHSQTLRVTLKKGSYEYLCTIPGHAKLGMKGLVGVGVTPTPTPTPTPTSTPTSTPSPGGGGTTATACASPVNTTVAVNEFDYGFTLSPRGSIPCGKITFNQADTGGVAHNFNLQSVAGGTGDLLAPGGTTSFTVTLGPGKYTYVCDIEGHDGLGMIGTLTVTG
jgi:plastocyanin